MDSTVLNVLVHAGKGCKAVGIDIALTASDSVTKLLTITGVDQLFASDSALRP
jgi:anti-anti-sigma factor